MMINVQIDTKKLCSHYIKILNWVEGLYPSALRIAALIFLGGFIWFIGIAIISENKEALATVAAAFAAAFAGIIGILLQFKDQEFRKKGELERLYRVAHMIYVELSAAIEALETAFDKHARRDMTVNPINDQLEIFKEFLPVIDTRARVAFIREISELPSEAIETITRSAHQSELYNATLNNTPSHTPQHRPSTISKKLVNEVYEKTRQACDELCDEFSFQRPTYRWTLQPIQ